MYIHNILEFYLLQSIILDKPYLCFFSEKDTSHIVPQKRHSVHHLWRRDHVFLNAKQTFAF